MHVHEIKFLKSDMFYANFSKKVSKVQKMKIKISVKLKFKSFKM